MAPQKDKVYKAGFTAGVESLQKGRRRQPLTLVTKAPDTAEFSRQVSYEDLFKEFYTENSALKPPYLPDKMYEIYEECGVLKVCVEAMVANIGGFGWDIVPVSGSQVDQDGIDPDNESPEKKKLYQFFRTPNGKESMDTIRKKLDRDYEVTGNSYFEVIRNLKKAPQLIFWADSKRMRLCPLEDTEVLTSLKILREDRWISIPFKQKFRKFMMVSPVRSKVAGSTPQVRFFKEYGDPRRLSAIHGKYWTDCDSKDRKDWIEATEIVHRKCGNGTYGVPRWIGELLDTLGLPKAQYINYDLFDSQGIPPMIITVSGGQLTEESWTDLTALFQKSKGAENFHKLLLLEAESTGYSLQDKEATPKLTIQSMSAYRKDDLLFQKFMEDARKAIRTFGFRLPGLFLGEHEGINYASSIVIRSTAEEQNFIPERKEFDELVNETIVKDLGITDWQFKSLPPFIKSNDEIIKLLPTLISSGALTINELIEFTNETFNLKLKPYGKEDAHFADIPVPMAIDAIHNFGNPANPGDTNGTTPQSSSNSAPSTSPGGGGSPSSGD